MTDAEAELDGAVRHALEHAGAGLVDAVNRTLEVYAAALEVVTSWLDIEPTPTLTELEAHGAAVLGMLGALAAAGVLDERDRLDPAAVSRLSPRAEHDRPGVIGIPPDGG